MLATAALLPRRGRYTAQLAQVAEDERLAGSGAIAIGPTFRRSQASWRKHSSTQPLLSWL